MSQPIRGQGRHIVFFLSARKRHTVDGFIFVGTNFRWHWNSWMEPSTKTTKIGTPRKLSHPQYLVEDIENLVSVKFR